MSHVRMSVPPTLYGPTDVSTSEPFSSSSTEIVGGTEHRNIYRQNMLMQHFGASCTQSDLCAKAIWHHDNLEK